MKQDKFLAIDFGTNSVGIALAFGELGVAFPKTCLKRISDLDLSLQIQKICTQEDISVVLIGMPSSGEIRKKILGFKKTLEKSLEQKIVLWDEDFTTLMSKDDTKIQSKEEIDALSATYILQDFLDSRRSKL